MILCCGEALIDMIPEATETGARGFVPHPGGAVFNTAIALGRLDIPAGLFTGLSTDLFGQQLGAALRASMVDMSLVAVSDRPTTLAFVHLDDGQARYSFFDENSAGRMLKPSDIPNLPESVTTLFFGGISLAAEPGAEAYAALLAQEGGTRVVMLDPNIRPGFIQDEGRYRARLDRMIAAADIIKISDEDLMWLDPGGDDVRQKARALLSKGPSLVILTMGAEGAIAFLAGGEVVQVAPERVDVVDTVGAGDTFNAGVLAALHAAKVLSRPALAEISPGTVEQALSFGAHVAAVTVSRAGANPPWKNEVRPSAGVSGAANL